MNRKYQSFEEIDQHLKILKLQKAINKEYLVLHTRKLKYALLPRYLIRNWDHAWQGVLISLVLRKLFRKKLT